MQLRKLTLKSKIGFGMHRDKTVARMLERISTTNYLQWMYFNASHIDLMDDVFVAAGLLDEHKIEKPGTSRALFDEFYKPAQINEVKDFIIKFDVNTGRNRKIMSYRPPNKITKEKLRSNNNNHKPFYK